MTRPTAASARRAMEIGLGLDLRLGLAPGEEDAIVREAARLGYASVWTNAGPGRAALDRCARWWRASAEAVDGGVGVGVAVAPVAGWSADDLARGAAEVARGTRGRFVLGVGAGGLVERPVETMRGWLRALGDRLRESSPRPPVYLGALGPRMLRLAGELASGAALNWCAPEHLRWSRARVAEGARRAGRDPAEVRLVAYVRVCVDEDEAAARRAFARAFEGYAFLPSYRTHLARMGFDAHLRALEGRRAEAPPETLAEALPDEALSRLGYYGAARGAAAALRRLAGGLDVAIVRVVPARPGLEAVRVTLAACRPALVRGPPAPGQN